MNIMSETLVTGVIIFLIIAVRGFQFWKRYGHDIDEFKEVVSTMEASHKTNKKVFGSKPLHVRSVINSK